MGSVPSHQSWFGNAVWKWGWDISEIMLFFSPNGMLQFFGETRIRATIFSSKMGISFLETRIGATTIDSVWKDVEVEC